MSRSPFGFLFVTGIQSTEQNPQPAKRGGKEWLSSIREVRKGVKAGYNELAQQTPALHWNEETDLAVSA